MASGGIVYKDQDSLTSVEKECSVYNNDVQKQKKINDLVIDIKPSFSFKTSLSIIHARRESPSDSSNDDETDAELPVVQKPTQTDVSPFSRSDSLRVSNRSQSQDGESSPNSSFKSSYAKSLADHYRRVNIPVIVPTPNNNFYFKNGDFMTLNSSQKSQSLQNGDLKDENKYEIVKSEPRSLPSKYSVIIGTDTGSDPSIAQNKVTLSLTGEDEEISQVKNAFEDHLYENINPRIPNLSGIVNRLELPDVGNLPFRSISSTPSDNCKINVICKLISLFIYN